MFSRQIVQDVLRRTLALDFAKGRNCLNPEAYQDSVVSMLIHEIFGGEILKTHKRTGWHFYNRINGERLDFTGAEKSIDDKNLEDIPTTPDETSSYFDTTDYSTFYMRFVSAFEEAV